MQKTIANSNFDELVKEELYDIEGGNLKTILYSGLLPLSAYYISVIPKNNK